MAGSLKGLIHRNITTALAANNLSPGLQCNHENRPVNQERGGNAGYNHPTEYNHGPQFNQGNRQERGGFGGGEQHFASFSNSRGGDGHRGRF